MNLFVVDLNKTASYQMSFTTITFCDRHYLTKSSRNYAFAFFTASPHHRVRFTTPSLTIRENGTVISIKHIVN